MSDTLSPGAMAFSKVPFTHLLGIKREFSRDGHARLVVETRHELENMIQAMHGGVIATLVDIAMASAAVSKINFTKTAVTLNLNTSYLSPGRGCLTADGEVVSIDADGGVVQCRAHVYDEEGRTVARSVGSFRYLEHR